MPCGCRIASSKSCKLPLRQAEHREVGDDLPVVEHADDDALVAGLLVRVRDREDRDAEADEQAVDRPLEVAVLPALALEAVHVARPVFGDGEERLGRRFVLDVPARQFAIDAEVDADVAVLVGQMWMSETPRRTASKSAASKRLMSALRLISASSSSSSSTSARVVVDVDAEVERAFGLLHALEVLVPHHLRGLGDEVVDEVLGGELEVVVGQGERFEELLDLAVRRVVRDEDPAADGDRRLFLPFAPALRRCPCARPRRPLSITETGMRWRSRIRSHWAAGKMSRAWRRQARALNLGDLRLLEGEDFGGLFVDDGAVEVRVLGEGSPQLHRLAVARVLTRAASTPPRRARCGSAR